MNEKKTTGGVDSPIFDALANRAPIDPLENFALSDVAPVEKVSNDTDADAQGSASADGVPPDAAARDAAKRGSDATDDTLSDEEFRFITRGVSDEEKAAVIAVLTQTRAEESRQIKRVERREHQPWARSQRVPEGLSDLIADA